MEFEIGGGSCQLRLGGAAGIPERISRTFWRKPLGSIINITTTTHHLSYDFPLFPQDTRHKTQEFLRKYHATMDSLGTSSLSAYASSDPKTAVMQQIRQEAAVQNARQLVEVSPSVALVCPSFPLYHPLANRHHTSKTTQWTAPANQRHRNSTNTASAPASPSLGPRSLAARRRASQPVWRSIWPPGTPSAGSISRAYSGRRDRGGLGEVSKRAMMLRHEGVR